MTSPGLPRNAPPPALIPALLASLLLHALVVWLGQAWPAGGRGAAVDTPMVVALRLPEPASVAVVPATRVLPEEMSSKLSKTPQIQAQSAFQAIAENDSGITLATPVYYTLPELDLPPYPLAELPALPPASQDYLMPGKVRVELWVDEAGRGVRIEVLATELPPELTELMAAAMLRQPFAPAQRQGLAVRARIRGELHHEPVPARARLRR